MTLSTLFKYLVGSRQAILDIAASRSSVFVGLLFVLAAGLAREYDGEDLRSEPWHLFLPLAASLVTSALLYAVLKLHLWLRGGEADGRKLGYQELLSLYWMTAPLALLYGIPVERFLSAADATRANLGLLGIVSLWRVLLMTRAIAVLYGVSFFRALFPLMLFADTVALTLISIIPVPVVSIMGGIRLTESEMVIHNVTMTVQVLGFLSWPIWLIGTIAAVGPTWQLADFREQRLQRTSPLLWSFAVVAIVLWLPPLPFTQAEQVLRRRAETDLRNNRIREALELMSTHDRNDFPPHWDPPPRLGYRETTPDIMDVMAHIDVFSAKDWVRSAYAKKFSNSLHGESEPGVWWELKPKEIDRRLAILEQLPEKAEIIEDHGYSLERAMQRASSPLRERIEKLLKESGYKFSRD